MPKISEFYIYLYILAGQGMYDDARIRHTKLWFTLNSQYVIFIACLGTELSYFFQNGDGGYFGFRGQDGPKYKKYHFHWICHANI